MLAATKFILLIHLYNHQCCFIILSLIHFRNYLNLMRLVSSYFYSTFYEHKKHARSSSPRQTANPGMGSFSKWLWLWFVHSRYMCDITKKEMTRIKNWTWQPAPTACLRGMLVNARHRYQGVGWIAECAINLIHRLIRCHVCTLVTVHGFISLHNTYIRIFVCVHAIFILDSSW